MDNSENYKSRSVIFNFIRALERLQLLKEELVVNGLLGHNAASFDLYCSLCDRLEL